MRVETRKAIDVPVTRAWEVIADFAHVNICHPMVESVTMRSTATSGVCFMGTVYLFYGDSLLIYLKALTH